MKIRNVKIIADLKGVALTYRSMVQASLDAMVPVLESSHWDEAWVETTGKYKTRLEGELNAAVKKLSNEKLALFVFKRIEKDANGITWHVIDDFDIDTYDGPSNVIGYGLAGDDITRVNIDFLKGDDPKNKTDQKDGGSNLVHEKFHDRGASHDSKATARRPNSAAYLSGTVYKIAFDEVYKEGLPSNVPVGSPVKPIETPIPAPAPITPAPVPSVPETPDTPVVVITNPTPVTATRICYKPWWGFGLITKCYNEKI